MTDVSPTLDRRGELWLLSLPNGEPVAIYLVTCSRCPHTAPFPNYHDVVWYSLSDETRVMTRVGEHELARRGGGYACKWTRLR